MRPGFFFDRPVIVTETRAEVKAPPSTHAAGEEWSWRPLPPNSPLVLKDVISRHAEAPAEARAFCAEHGLLLHVEAAVHLVKLCFPLIRNLALRVQQDPEEGEEWLLVRAAVGGTKEEALQSYRQYVRRWTGGVPLPQRAKVRLSYTISNP
jgi:hypothetical protein